MRAVAYVVFSVSLLASGAVMSQASGGNTGPTAVAATGLGQSGRSANLSLDPNWKVFAFERRNFRYLQIEDQNGIPRAAISYIGDLFWTLPVGPDVDRVSTPQDPIAIPSAAVKRVVYRSQDVELSVYGTSAGVVWSVSKP